MRFTLLDRIVALEPGVRIEGVKSLSAAEEYLADHFPLFPVMPGVLMLEAMTQAAAWLIRATEDFAHSIVVLKEARNIRYADFTQPGHTLRVTAELLSQDGNELTFKTKGTVDGRVNVNAARLIMTRYNLADINPAHAGRDARVREQMRDMFKLLFHPEDLELFRTATGAPPAAE